MKQWCCVPCRVIWCREYFLAVLYLPPSFPSSFVKFHMYLLEIIQYYLFFIQILRVWVDAPVLIRYSEIVAILLRPVITSSIGISLRSPTSELGPTTTDSTCRAVYFCVVVHEASEVGAWSNFLLGYGLQISRCQFHMSLAGVFVSYDNIKMS